MESFRNVTFKTWNLLETWHSKHEIFLNCFRTVTFKTWNVLEMGNMKFYRRTWWLSKSKMFQELDFQTLKCFRNVTFQTYSCFVRHVTFLKYFIFSTSRFRNIARFELHVSETFHFLNVTLLKHFMFWTSPFWNISCFVHKVSETIRRYFERHVSKTFVTGHNKRMLSV